MGIGLDAWTRRRPEMTGAMAGQVVGFMDGKVLSPGQGWCWARWPGARVPTNGEPAHFATKKDLQEIQGKADGKDVPSPKPVPIR